MHMASLEQSNKPSTRMARLEHAANLVARSHVLWTG